MEEKVCQNCSNMFARLPGYQATAWKKKRFCNNRCSGIFRMKTPLIKTTITGAPIGVRGIDITGKKFGKLTVIRLHSRSRNGRVYWVCTCECGLEITVAGTSITRNNNPQKSCGCITPRGKNRKDWTGYEEISGQFWSQVIRSANGEKGRRIIDLEITIQEAWELYVKQNKKCSLSGLPIAFPIKWDTRGTASLDRIDSARGYTIDNVQWLHKDVNKMKNAFDQDYFLGLCMKVREQSHKS